MGNANENYFSANWGLKKITSVILVVLFSVFAYGETEKMSKDLKKMGADAQVNVIVQYYNPPTSDNENKAHNAGAKNHKKLAFNFHKYTMSPRQAAKLLAGDANVKYISPDRKLTGMLDITTATVGADIARNYGFDGAGVGVAVIDSGVSPNNDLYKRVVYSQSFSNSTSNPYDQYGHGTHVASIVAGNGYNSTCSTCFATMRGIAPRANIINLKVLDQYGKATDSELINAINAAISLKNQYNIRVLNMSVGRPVYESYTTDPLTQAVERAWKAGIVVVVAAGNSGRANTAGNQGYGTINSPANDPYVITVGAMRTNGTTQRGDDTIASYSSKGPTAIDHVVKPDIVAPGNQVVAALASPFATLFVQNPLSAIPISTYSNGWFSSLTSSAYFRLSGTSMAAPVVSGAAALLIQQNPNITPDQVKARLMKTASKTFPVTSSYTDPLTGTVYTSQYDIFTVGAGYLDIMSALNNVSRDVAPATVGIAKSPIAKYDPNSGLVTLVRDSSLLWGDSVLWGDYAVWGNSVISGSSPSGSVLWGESVLWGDASCSAFSVLWGDTYASDATATSLLWGESVLWGDTLTSEATSVATNGDGTEQATDAPVAPAPELLPE